MHKRKTIHEKRSAQRWRAALLILCLIAFSLIIYIVFFSTLFKISQVAVVLERVNCVDENSVKTTANLVGQWFFRVDENLAKNLQKKYSCVSWASLNKVIPNKIEIKLIGRNPTAVIKVLNSESSSSALLSTNLISSSESAQLAKDKLLDFSKLDSNQSFVVDQNGVIFALGESLNVPSLFISGGNFKLGESLESGLIKNAVLVLNGLATLGVSAPNTKIVGSDLVINSEPKIVISLDRDIKTQLASLQLILEEAKMEDVTMELIDLRFSNPIVKYVKKGESSH